MSSALLLTLLLAAPPAATAAPAAATLNCRPLLTKGDVESVCGVKRAKRMMNLSAPRTDACMVSYEFPPSYANLISLTLGKEDAAPADPAKALADSAPHADSTTSGWHPVAGAGDAAVAWETKLEGRLVDRHVWLLAGTASIHVEAEGGVCTETQLVTLATKVLSRVKR